MQKTPFIALILVALTLQASSAKGQMYAAPSSSATYYQFLWRDTVAVVKKSAIDTLTAQPNLSGASWLSYSFEVTDSAKCSVYTDYSPIGRTGHTWTAKDTTSVSNSSEAALITEKLLRGPTIDKLGALGGLVRIRIIFQATGNDTTLGKYSLIVNWK